jgi:hypothetical protein
MGEDLIGNGLYALYGDASIEADEAGNLFVNAFGTSYYTTAAGTKGDWLLRQYGDEIVVRDNAGIAYARFDSKDWYISSLPRIGADASGGISGINADNDLAYLRNTQGEAGVQAETQNQDLNASLADAKPMGEYTDFVENFGEKLQYNIQSILGPANPAAVDAELSESEKDIYSLEYDEYDVLRRVDSQGRVHPEDSDKLLELDNAYNKAFADTTAELTSAVDHFQFGYFSPTTDADREAGYHYVLLPDGLTYVRAVYGEDGALQIHPDDMQLYRDTIDKYYAGKDIVVKDPSYAELSNAVTNSSQITINTDLLFQANGLPPGNLLKLDSNSGMLHPTDLDFDPSTVWKLVLGGKDGADMSDETFLYYYKQAIKDVAMQEIIPGGITVTQKIFGAAAAIAELPILNKVPISKFVQGLNYAVQFPGEILKNFSIHYNDSNYTWEQAVTDAFKAKGIETVVDMSAESLGKYIAKRYNMDEYSEWLLTKGLNTVLEEYGKKEVEIF